MLNFLQIMPMTEIMNIQNFKDDRYSDNIHRLTQIPFQTLYRVKCHSVKFCQEPRAHVQEATFYPELLSLLKLFKFQLLFLLWCAIPCPPH